ncbi:MAG: YitT family protein [Chitinophagaceae bacterium]|nr:YitT family protein [Chitinophagaceae bacterium]
MNTHQPPLYTFKSALLMLCGVISAAFALKGFMIPNHFLDGGVTGISLLIHESIHIPFSAVFLVLNLFFLIPAYYYIGKAFAMRSLIAGILLALAVQYMEVPSVTSDKLLIAIFGGCFIGIGIGLVMRSGAALDGFEILAEATIKRIGLSMSEVILGFNIIIFLGAALHFGIESAMYSIITYFAALKMVDYVVDGIEEYISLNIISGESDTIRTMIVSRFGKGITVYKGERGFLPGSIDVSSDCDVIMTIVTRLELLEITKAVRQVDPKAFLFTNKIHETHGGVVKQKSHHHV